MQGLWCQRGKHVSGVVVRLVRASVHFDGSDLSKIAFNIHV